MTTALDIEGYGTVPPITQWIPEFKGAPIYFGIFVPKGVPDDGGRNPWAPRGTKSSCNPPN